MYIQAFITSKLPFIYPCLCLGLLVRRDPLQHVLEARHVLVGLELEQSLLQSLVEPSSTILKTRNLFTVASDLETSETVKNNNKVMKYS